MTSKRAGTANTIRSLLVLSIVPGAAAFVLCATVRADVVTVAADRDNTLYEDASGSLSNGAGDYFFAGNNSGSNTRRGLVYFDVASAIPSGALINSVQLTLHSSQGNYPAPAALHLVTSDWGEGTSDAIGSEGSGAPATTGDATWLHNFYDNSFWSTPGGDFAPTASASQTITGVGFFNWGSNPALVSDVQDWLDSPASNYGWILLGDENNASTSLRFDSRDNPDETFRPMLMIDYTTVPSPAGLALLALAGLKKRRRRG